MKIKRKINILSGVILLLGFGLGYLWSVFSWITILLSIIIYLLIIYVFPILFNFTKLEQKFRQQDSNNEKLSLEQKEVLHNLDKLEKKLKAVSRGNLSINIKSLEDRSSISDSFKSMVFRLRDLISKSMRLSVILSSASQKWADATQDLSIITDQHAVAVEELVDDNEKIVNSVSEANMTLEKIIQEYVNQGLEIMNELENKMADNLCLMNQLTERVSILDKKMSNITLITETINKLAKETNLLSLNASIEAARAGNEGRAFSVVAQEVGDLADDSLSSSKEIMEVITEVQQGIKEVVNSVEETKKGVDEQQGTVKEVSYLFDNIVKTTKNIGNELVKIDDQAHNSFNETEDLNTGIQKQAGDVDYMVDQADRIAGVSSDLQHELDRFKFIKLAYTKVEETSASVAKKLLEKKLNVGVVIIPLNYAEMYHSVAKGILDGMVSSWVPKTHEKYLQEFAKRFEDLGTSLGGCRIGLVVPNYLQANSITGLKEIVSKFREKKIFAIEKTAGVTIAAQNALEDYSLKGWTVEPVGLDNVIKKLRSAISNKEAVVVTGWKPHWMFEEFSLKFLNDPQKTFGSEEEIHTIARPRLKEDNPQVYEILKGLKFDMKEYTKMMYRINKGESPEKIAEKYVEENFKCN